MRLALLTLGRLVSRTEASVCSTRTLNAVSRPLRPFRVSIRAFSCRADRRFGHSTWRARRPIQGTLVATAGGILAFSVFLEHPESEKSKPNHGPAGNERKDELPLKELDHSAHDCGSALSQLPQKVVLFLDIYLWEPICTGLRFLQLAAIFIPVILTIPAIWIGNRQPDRDNERSGTLWWYGFLVRSMEWAGPAFIKVHLG